MQYFKPNDQLEQKFVNSFEELIAQIIAEKQAFYASAYETKPFGDMIWDAKSTPLANAIKKTIYRDFFNEIFTQFRFAGSFESYISVFKKIFGETVELEFVIPDPGKLNINITANDIVLNDFIARYISENQYFYDEIIDYDLDNIVFQNIKGFESEYEVNQMLFELVPNGIYTQIALDFA